MIVGIAVTVLAGIVAIPVVIFTLEIVLSLMALKSVTADKRDLPFRPRIAVLVPAHNEEAVLSQTLILICAQLEEPDLLLVVADNCNDKTAEIARDSNATVLERIDSANRGKGFALDYGISFLAQDPPDVVIIIDADCLIGPGLIDTISRICISENRPVQGLYIMKHTESDAALGKRIRAFAWHVKNYARPLGLKLIGMPCQLMGSGMAIPFSQLKQVELGSSNIVEDMQLGIDLASAGYPSVFCPEVKVESSFPLSECAENTQRKRWEHGHINMIISRAPGLLMKALVKRDVKLFALILDLMVPPLTLLATLALVLVVASGVTMFVWDEFIAFSISGFTLLLFTCSVFLAWLGYGRDIISLTELVFLPMQILKKIPLYIQFALNRQKKWIRTGRD